MLYIVPTPIGHLKDLTIRALDVLKSVHLILAEDTRVTKHLLDKYEIKTSMKSFHAHNEHAKLDGILDLLKNKSYHIALVSDGGTPGISDPGYLLINACIQHHIALEVLPGASAVTTAVVSSGLPCDRFYFEGFLPHKKGRVTRLNYIARLDQTVILYESPHRLLKCLKQLIDHCGPDRKVALCKELTKKFQKIYRGSLHDVYHQLDTIPKIKGEYVIVLSRKK